MTDTWDEKSLLSFIRKRKRAGEAINLKEIRNNFRPAYSASITLFGSWRKAIEKADIDYDTIRVNKGPPRKWSQEKVVGTILKLSEAGKPLYAHHILHNYGTLYTAAGNYFGSWRQAIKAAGLDYTKIRRKLAKKWTRELVLEEIKRRRAEGLPLNEWEAGSYLTSPARRLFGSWQKAINAAGLTYGEIKKGSNRKKGWWTPNRVLMRIRQLEKQGVRLNSKNMHQHHAALLDGGKRFFGSWYQALRAADIDYRKHARNWSTKAWLSQMSDDEYNALLGRSDEDAT